MVFTNKMQTSLMLLLSCLLFTSAVAMNQAGGDRDDDKKEARPSHKRKFEESKDEKQEQENVSCSICSEPLNLQDTENQVWTPNCLHSCHMSCIRNFERFQQDHGVPLRCPTCRSPLPIITHEQTIDSILDKIAEAMFISKKEDDRIPYYERLIAQLIGLNFQPNTLINRFDNKVTALHFAADKNCFNGARLLIARGARVNVQNTYGWTPLFFAVSRGHEKIAQLLIDHSTIDDVELQDTDGRSVLHLAVENNNVDMINIIVNKDININVQITQNSLLNTRGEAPLHIAAKYNHGESAQNLLNQRNIAVDIKNAAGQTPLHYAVKKNNNVVAAMLIAHHANANIPDNNGNTPLHIAAQAGNSRMVRLLLDGGAHVTTRNNAGQIPLDVADQFDDELVETLKMAMEDINRRASRSR